jgi:hypothetical protein
MHTSLRKDCHTIRSCGSSNHLLKDILPCLPAASPSHHQGEELKENDSLVVVNPQASNGLVYST